MSTPRKKRKLQKSDGPTVDIFGVKLPQFQEYEELPFPSLQPVQSTVDAIKQMAIGVSMGLPVLAVGPVGSGKTVAVEWLGRKVGRRGPHDFVKIQLSEDMDGKVLFGFYRSTEIPSEFVWILGPLTKALMDGSWVLLEDLDSAPNDVLCSLISIIERHEINVPGRGIVKADKNFRLFVTLRTKANGHLLDHSKSFILDKPWLKVDFKPFAEEEMRSILEGEYPQLKKFSERLLAIFAAVRAVRETSRNDSRSVSLRDFLKWCRRLSTLPNLDDMTHIYLESFECFGAHLLTIEGQRLIANVLAQNLNINVETLDYYMSKHKPDVSMEGVKFKVGRCQFKRPKVLDNDRRDNFALTRPATILLERIAVCVKAKEPVLLVGETGCGKTATVQILAKYSSHRLHVVNLNQQSETGDLIGGMKPVDFKHLLTELKQSFLVAFNGSFSRQKNGKFLQNFENCWAKSRWVEFLQLMAHIAQKGMEKETDGTWAAINAKVKRMMIVVSKTREALAFGFVEGILTKAVKNGEWILLDEINLATPETLDCLYSLLDSYETDGQLNGDVGSSQPIKIHPEFRLFACMNPATDVGKQNLTPGIRSRFTEFAVGDVESEEDLTLLVLSYLEELSVSHAQIGKIIRLYKTLRSGSLKLTSDTWGHLPNFSLRTFCRALNLAQNNSFKNVTRSLYEAFCLSFLTELDTESHNVVQKLIQQLIIGDPVKVKQVVNESTNPPRKGNFRKVEGFWLECGTEPVESDRLYVMTETVRSNAKDLARAISAQLHPVLLQGETSVGKTSLIKHLAKLTGNKCVRINNHEHTDLQEYFGSYCADANGKLTFIEGPLVQAIRKGYWVILDELNLAPPEVLESLNRLLDDNRELFIPETQEVVKPNNKFLLFATQNPPGLYSGRKQLSRAFRNRFIELHFNELPFTEVETILQHRCDIPASYAKKMVQTMQDLQIYRNTAGVFAGKESYMTLRDLFRWGERYRKEQRQEGTFFDWDQYLADQGFLLLAGRVRRSQDVEVVVHVIEKRFGRKVDQVRIFAESSPYLMLKTNVELEGFCHIFWAENLRRQAVLLGQALKFEEPVLLIGETGCGKTTLCQMFAQLQLKQLISVNCHLMTEASDFLGKLKPASAEQMERGVLFEWYDGPLVVAMRSGVPLLIDEISLADDSVLERLNSVLEPERTILLAEKGVDPSTAEEQNITAERGFNVMATMNPGGDYGKKELSKALRNRFTEIWCDSNHTGADLMRIVDRNIASDFEFPMDSKSHSAISRLMIDFVRWLSDQHQFTRRVITIRDILSWVDFMNRSRLTIEWPLAFVHGAALVLLEGMAGQTFNVKLNQLREQSVRHLCNQVSRTIGKTVRQRDIDGVSGQLVIKEGKLGIEPFFIPLGPVPVGAVSYTFETPTCLSNVYRILRALQVKKPILLEGPPGVGKSSIVTALTKASGNILTRINLSEQTDMSDLFGCDLPTALPNGQQGFAWNDGILLTALKEGHWILLDEMNLASQAVLEGLNACFDHRGEVSIPELGKTFKVDYGRTRFFASQNPLRQGEGRKGLPKSFINRFSVVFMDMLAETDQFLILRTSFPEIPADLIAQMIRFNMDLHQKICIDKVFATAGSPWEFNLRDTFRWCETIMKYQKTPNLRPDDFVALLYTSRLRTAVDRENVSSLYCQTFGLSIADRPMEFSLTPNQLQISNCVLPRSTPSKEHWEYLKRNNIRLLPSMYPAMESLMHCINLQWLAILVGPPGSGKTTLIQSLAALLGQKLSVVHMTTETDASELVGSFEQVTRDYYVDQLCEQLALIINQENGSNGTPLNSPKLLKLLEKAKRLKNDVDAQMSILNSLIDNLTSAGIDVSILEKRRQECAEIGSSVRFEWIDSSLVEAVKQGYWLLIENVNFCNAAVLDRLNCFLEPGGRLVINERGLVDGKTISYSAHPNFRLFFTMDSRYGEISRPMRNRGVEICLLEEASWSKSEREIASVMNQFGLNLEKIHDLIEHKGKSPYSLFQSGVLASFRWKELDPSIFGNISESEESLFSYAAKSVPPFTDPLIHEFLSKESSWELWRTNLLLNYMSSKSEREQQFSQIWIMLRSSSINLANSHLWASNKSTLPERIETLEQIFHYCADVHLNQSDNHWPMDIRWNCGRKPIHSLTVEDESRLNWHLLRCRAVEYVYIGKTNNSSVMGITVGKISGNKNRIVLALANNLQKFFNSIIVQFNELARNEKLLLTQESQLLSILSGMMYLRQLKVLACRPFDENAGTMQLSVLWSLTEKHLMRLLDNTLEEDLRKVTASVSKVLTYNRSELKRFCLTTKPLLSFLQLPNSSTNALLKVVERLASKLDKFADDLENREEVHVDMITLRDMKNSLYQLFECSEDTSRIEALDQQINEAIPKVEMKDSNVIDTKESEETESELATWLITRSGQLALQGCLLMEIGLNKQNWSNVTNYLLKFTKTFPLAVWNVLHRQNESSVVKQLQFLDLLDSDESHIQLLQRSSVTRALLKLGWSQQSDNFSSVTIAGMRNSFDAARKALGYLWAQGDFVFHFISKLDENLLKMVTTIRSELGIDQADENSAELWSLYCSTGSSLLCRMGKVPSIDPLSLNTWKYAMLKDQRDQLRSELTVIQTEFKIVFNQEISEEKLLAYHPHPLVKFLIERRHQIEKKLMKLEKHINICGFQCGTDDNDDYFNELPVRPHSQFSALRNDIDELCELCNAVAQFIFTPIDQTSIVNVANRHAQLSNWSRSVTYLIKRIANDYVSFLDITGPYIFATNLLKFGANLLCAKLDLLLTRNQLTPLNWTQVESLLHSFMEVPSCLLNDPNLSYDLPQCEELLGNHYAISHANLTMKKAVLSKKWQSNEVTKSTVQNVFKWFCQTWRDQKKPESDRYYEYKSKNEGLSDDELDQKQMEKQFPDYSGWFHAQSLGTEELEMETANDLKGSMEFLKESDVYPLWTLLESLLKSDLMSSADLVNSVAECLQLRLQLGSSWLWKFVDGLGNRDNQLLGANLVSVKKFIMNLQPLEHNSAIDVYHNGDLNAAVRCKELLDKLLTAVANLLQQWPEHPALIQICISVKRLTGLSVKTPLMKLAAAVEDLLRDCEQWETVAASFVSLKGEIMPLRELLLEWRKREVLSWNNLLNDVELEQLQSASTYGLELIDAVKSAICEVDKIDELLETVKQFLEFSPIGQFHERLAMLRLIIYIIWEPNNKRASKIQTQLANFYHYYQIFTDAIRAHRISVRAPVEKELKDFVKIVKFNDLNFFSMQQSAQKSHKQLFKFVKRYKASLNENVNPIMVNLVSLPNSDYFPTPSTWHSIELGAVDSSGHLPKYYEKLCGFCSELAAAAPHSDFFADAKEMLDSANDMLNSFSKQVVYEGTDEEKEKQFRVAMNKNQNVWTDFFKSLHSEGFSYKKGMQFFSNHSNTAFFNQPVEIDYGVLREGRQDVESAFFTAVQYAMYFHSSSQKPNAQLNPSAVQKMTGLVGILMSTALEQRKRLVIFEENVKGLKEAISQLNVMVSDCNNYGIIPDQPRARTIVTEHRLTLEKSVVLMTETKKLLECCPAKAQLSEHLLDMVAEQSPLICSISAEDQVYIDVVKNIDEILQFLAKSYVLLTSEPDVGYISWKRLDQLCDVAIKLNNFGISERLQFLQNVMVFRDNSCTLSCCGKGIIAAVGFIEKLLKITATIATLKSDMKNVEKSQIMSNSSEHTMQKVLVTVQSVYKMPLKEDLDMYSYCSLMNDYVDKLKLSEVLDSIKSLEEEILSGHLTGLQSRSYISCLIIFLEVFSRLADFSSCQYGEIHKILCTTTSRIVGSFIRLLEKGYVNPVPQNDDSAEKSGSKKFEDCEGTGMGEGQGAKDVSEEIEDLGQIEGTKGEEKNESDQPDQPPPEGKNPIDLDEDIFEGNLEDVKLDQNESENEEGKEDEEEKDLEADQKMGDVEDSQDDQLDPHLWDEEKKEEKEEGPNLDSESKGADVKQNKMVAKDKDHAEPKDKPELDPLDLEENLADAEMTEEQDGENPETDEKADENEDVHLENLCLDGEEPDGSEADENEESHEGQRTEDNDETKDEENGTEEQKLEEIIDDNEKTEEKSESEVTLSKTGGGGQIQLDSEGGQDGVESSQDKQQCDFAENQSENQEETSEKLATNEEEISNRSGGSKDVNAKLTESSTGDQLMPKQNDKRPSSNQEPLANKRTKTSDVDKTKGSVNDRTLTNKLEVERKNMLKDGVNSEEMPENAECVAHAKDLDPNSLQIVDSSCLEDAKGQNNEMSVEPIVLDFDNETPENAESDLLKKKAEMTTGTSNSTLAKGDRSTEEDVEPIEAEWNGQEIPSRDDTSTIHTAMDFYDQACHSLASMDFVNTESTAAAIGSDEESRRLWSHYQNVTQPLAAELTENLRLILEPTLSSKLQGDYRTGKRLNIRKLIPYIASNFRKNKIWLRRTRKSKRDYQVLIAIDDSASMCDNQTKQMAFEAVTLLSNTLTHLEVGKLAICKFGETAQLLHGFQDSFSDETGAQVLSSLAFEQKGTSIIRLMELTSASFQQQSSSSVSELPARLLLIISDGRGVFAEGTEKVMSAVKLALAQKVFIVFVILDNPHSQDSILDIKVPLFGENNVITEIKSYMELFPFPFYIILRQIGSLPAVVGEALRQWFEIVTCKA